MSLSITGAPPLITKEAWLAATAPITASYVDATGETILTEPRSVEWTDDGMRLTFKFSCVKIAPQDWIRLTINGVTRSYNPVLEWTMEKSGAAFRVAIVLPYE